MSFVWFADKPLRTREEIARIVHSVSLRRNLDELATVIALMTVAVEVGADDKNGQMQWWCPWNAADPQTKQFEYDSQSNDSLSSGYFQQQVSRPGAPGRPWGWGGLFGVLEGARKRMTLEESADMFLAALAEDYRRAAGNPVLAGEFAQRVQQSAHPERYTKKWDEAWQVLRRALATGPVEPQNPTEEPLSTWTGDPVWIEDVLRPALGDRLKTLPGWKTRGHGDFKDIRGVMVHHTGNSRESAQSIANGRPDLVGPLANLHIAPDGTVTIVAVGVCWHAGVGSYPWLPTNNANWHMIGIECAWPTPNSSFPNGYDPNERWPDAQVISMRDTCAALCLRLSHPATRVIGHKEYAGVSQGKWDPGNMNMPWFRGEVAKDMRGEFDTVPPVQPIPILPPDYSKEIWDQLRNEWPQLGGQTLVNAVGEMRDALLNVNDYANWKAGQA